jgi:hypothetical protein
MAFPKTLDTNCYQELAANAIAGLAFPCLGDAVDGGGGLESGLVFGEVVGLEKGLFDGLLVAENAADGLVVEELGELEEHGVVEGGLGF